MKRSGQVGLVLMGAAAFVGTYASVRAYQAAPQAAQSCTPRPDGTQSCQSTQRSFSYYLWPSFMHGSASSSTAEPRRAPAVGLSSSSALAASAPAPGPAAHFRGATAPSAQPVALTSAPRPSSSTGAATERGGFGTTARSAPMRVSSGG